jgi:protein-L-isoaspartate(D-aspartate) O-methyltransferase
MTDYSAEREAMVERQLRRRGISEPHILEAFRAVPREAFISDEYAHLAYGDHPLPIEAGQTISQPYIVALTIQAADIERGDKVLEVGAGSGYAAAVISRIADKVVAGDGTKGCPDHAPFDAIVAAASGSHVPKALLAQLAPGGRIVMPVGSPGGIQELIKVTKQEDGTLSQESLGGVRFVPLIGEEGWKNG